MQPVSLFGHARMVSVQSCRVSLVHVGDLNIVTAQYSYSHVGNVLYYFSCLCVLCSARASDCDVDAFVGGSVFSGTEYRT